MQHGSVSCVQRRHQTLPEACVYVNGTTHSHSCHISPSHPVSHYPHTHIMYVSAPSHHMAHPHPHAHPYTHTRTLTHTLTHTHTHDRSPHIPSVGIVSRRIPRDRSSCLGTTRTRSRLHGGCEAHLRQRKMEADQHTGCHGHVMA